jgi:hypothetical protein
MTLRAYEPDEMLFAENNALSTRLRRVSAALDAVAWDFAAARREVAALRRENALLRASSVDTATASARTGGRLAAGADALYERSLSAVSVLHDAHASFGVSQGSDGRGAGAV